MTEPLNEGERKETALLSLETRRWIEATPKRVFAAWTNPLELKKWWGPNNVRCITAEVDLRVGGRYRIGNELPDKSVVWIEGVFEEIEEPALLVYTWSVGSAPASAKVERVTVRFMPSDAGTEIIVQHQGMASPELRDQHLQGWLGCMDGLEVFLTSFPHT